MNQPKVLIFDIETAPMVAYVWGLRDQNISLNQIRNDWYVLAWSAKWLGDPPSKVMYKDQRHAKHIENDKQILIPLWKLLDEADIVVTQNGKNFDGPKLNARFITHGMNPPSPYKHLDTYQIVRRVAKFTSNKLEYLTDKLCTKYKKLSHSEFPGMSLWTECLKGNKKAWEAMKKYNIHDVLSTEEFYTKIRAWAPGSTGSVYIDNQKCSVCGRPEVIKSGIRLGFQRYRCMSCGHNSQIKKAA
jgi:DNA polymerase elongation subunit (family B)